MNKKNGDLTFELLEGEVFVSMIDITEFLREMGAPKRIISHLEHIHEGAYDALIKHN